MIFIQQLAHHLAPNSAFQTKYKLVTVASKWHKHCQHTHSLAFFPSKHISALSLSPSRHKPSRSLPHGTNLLSCSLTHATYLLSRSLPHATNLLYCSLPCASFTSITSHCSPRSELTVDHIC